MSIIRYITNNYIAKKLLNMYFITTLLTAVLLNISNVYASETSSNPADASGYLKDQITALRKILMKNPNTALEKNKKTMPLMRTVLLEAPGLTGGSAAYETMDAATLATYRTMAGAYICQQHWETRPGLAPTQFLEIWDEIHQRGKVIDFARYASNYADLVFPSMDDKRRETATTKWPQKFQQQNVLNRILHIIAMRIEHNEYLIEKWNTLPDLVAQRQFFADFSGFSGVNDARNSERHQALTAEHIIKFRAVCEEDKSNYEYLLELINAKEYLLAQTFANQRGFDCFVKNQFAKTVISSKKRGHVIAQDGDEGIFLKKIVYYMNFLDFELPILDQQFFGQPVRKIILEAQTINFLDDLNAGLKVLQTNQSSGTGEISDAMETILRVFATPPEELMDMLARCVSRDQLRASLAPVTSRAVSAPLAQLCDALTPSPESDPIFFPESLLNAQKWLEQLEELHRTVGCLRAGRAQDQLSQSIATKRTNESKKQRKVTQHVLDVVNARAPEKIAPIASRKIICPAHCEYMVEFFKWAVPIYQTLKQRSDHLKASRAVEYMPTHEKKGIAFKRRLFDECESTPENTRGKTTLAHQDIADVMEARSAPLPDVPVEEAQPFTESGVVTSDHNNLPSSYWTEEHTDLRHITEFWKTWTQQPQDLAPVAVEDEKCRAQQAFVQAFIADKQPNFFTTLNEFRRLFDVRIERSLNGFVKLYFPQQPSLQGFFHVPHPDSDIGRDAMWAREVHRCLSVLNGTVQVS